jgi:hypothetical protein
MQLPYHLKRAPARPRRSSGGSVPMGSASASADRPCGSAVPLRAMSAASDGPRRSQRSRVRSSAVSLGKRRASRAASVFASHRGAHLQAGSSCPSQVQTAMLRVPAREIRGVVLRQPARRTPAGRSMQCRGTTCGTFGSPCARAKLIETSRQLWNASATLVERATCREVMSVRSLTNSVTSDGMALN